MDQGEWNGDADPCGGNVSREGGGPEGHSSDQQPRGGASGRAGQVPHWCRCGLSQEGLQFRQEGGTVVPPYSTRVSILELPLNYAIEYLIYKKFVFHTSSKACQKSATNTLRICSCYGHTVN